MVKICNFEGCRARAWQGALCNYHALAQYRARAGARPTAKKIAQGKRWLRQRARELGIVLAQGEGEASENRKAPAPMTAPPSSPESKGDVVSVPVVSALRPKRPRSPVG